VINVYSIEEIIAASDAILTNLVAKKKSIIDKGPALDKINKEIELSMNIKEKKLIDQSIPQEINNIILEAENSLREKKINKPLKQSDLKNEHSLEDLKVTKEELAESMHLTFSKKIKKNTLKLILDLKEEIIFLTKNISSLKEKKKKEELNNKILKQNVFDLKQIENKLDHHLKRIQAELDTLKNKNEKLNLDYDLLKEQHEDLIEKNILLNNDNIKIKSELTAYINKDSIAQSKITKLEEEILNNNNLLNKTASDDEEIKSELNDYKNTEKNLREKNQELQKSINDLKSNVNHNDRDKTIIELEDKIKHYQDENIRIGSELFESNKKFEITKESLSELQNNRSHLIEKINSINEVIKNENIVTSVFQSDAGNNKIKITDNNKPAKKDKVDLDIEIKNIFSSS
jgi:hypothetical protein